MFKAFICVLRKLKINRSINWNFIFIFFFFFFLLPLFCFQILNIIKRREEQKFEKRWLERSNKESRVTAVARIKHPVSSIGCLLRISLFPSAFWKPACRHIYSVIIYNRVLIACEYSMDIFAWIKRDAVSQV